MSKYREKQEIQNKNNLKDKSLKNYLHLIRESKIFSNLTTSIILIYAVLLGFKTIGNIENEFSTLLQIFDSFITIYFLIEIIIKMSAEKNFFDFFKSGWNVFDFIEKIA